MKLIEEIQLLSFCFSVIICSTQLSDNLIINSNFTQPQLSQYSISQNFPFSIPGWKCKNSCEINNCQNLIKFRTEINSMGPLCSGNVLDLNSNTVNVIASQTLRLKVGTYKINFVYYLPYQKANLKKFYVRFNQALLLYVHPLVKGASQGVYFSIDVLAVEGDNVLTFQNKGYSADTIGFKIGNVGVFRTLDTYAQSLLKNVFQFEFLSKASSLPGGRVFLGSLLGFMINLDRYQLYAYHHRSYSYNAERLLQQIGMLQNKKGMVFWQKIRDTFTKFTASLKDAFKVMNFKNAYFNYRYLEEANLSSFLRDFLTFSFLIVLLIYSLLHCSFRIFQRWRLSLFFRQYAFHATLLFALTEGSLEEITFHCFAELRFLFSRSIGHKLFNCCAVALLFVVVFICFAFYLWLKAHYEKKAKIVADVETATLFALISVGFDRGVMMFLFGVTHQLLLSTPTVQMAVLISLEALWILKRIYSHRHYRHTALFIVVLLDSLLRLYFQITTLIYDLIAEQRFSINEKHHKNLFSILIGLIVLEIILNLYFLLKKWLVNFFKNSTKIQQSPPIIQQYTPFSSPISNIQAGRYKSFPNNSQNSPIFEAAQLKRKMKVLIRYSNKPKIVRVNDSNK